MNEIQAKYYAKYLGSSSKDDAEDAKVSARFGL